MFTISFNFFMFVFVSKIEICLTETNHFCDMCEEDTSLRTDPLTLVSAHNIPGRRHQDEMILYFLCLKMFLYQKVAKSTWQVDVPRSGNRQSRSTVQRPRLLPAILMLAQNKVIRGQTIEGKSKTGFKPIWFPLSKLWQVGKRAAFLSQHNDVQLGYQVKRSLSWWKKTASF